MSSIVDLVKKAIECMDSHPSRFLILHHRERKTWVSEMWDDSVICIGSMNRLHPNFIDEENQQFHFHDFSQPDHPRFASYNFSEFSAVGFHVDYNESLKWPVNPKCPEYTIQKVGV
jgi:hypothetical protein